MDDKDLISKLEALLFLYGEPIELKKITKIIELEEPELEKGIAALENELLRGERGLQLIKDKGKVQLVTKPQFSKLLENIAKLEFSEELTPAALETLSIIAYASPISRANVEYIRGVNSSFIMRALLMRGLVVRETDPKRFNVYLYSASFDLLRHLGLAKVDDLPEFQKYRALVEQMCQEIEQKDKIQIQQEFQEDN